MASAHPSSPHVFVAPFELANLSPTLAIMTGIEPIGNHAHGHERNERLAKVVHDGLSFQRPVDDRARYIRAVNTLRFQQSTSKLM